MTPSPGERLLRFVGDYVRFELQAPPELAPNACTFLRTNLGKESTFREEIIATYAGRRPLSVAFWRDLPLDQTAPNQWSIEMPLVEPGFFRAKAYLLDKDGRQLWPDGPDAGISIHPNCYRAANTIYCAFTRMFGETRTARSTRDPRLEEQLQTLDQRGYSVIPPSGQIRDLIRQLPHIMNTIGCRILPKRLGWQPSPAG